jgi:hypothetical protein
MLQLAALMVCLIVMNEIHVCPRPCYTWEDPIVVGPAIAETVCYNNMTCFHPINKCPNGYKRCLRADDEEYWEYW